MIQPNDLCATKKALDGFIFTIFPIVSYTFVFWNRSILYFTMNSMYGIYRNLELGLGIHGLYTLISRRPARCA